ncbi:hypothetical protein ACYZTX_00520 [Pseudomonas sp. MDT1-17]
MGYPEIKKNLLQGEQLRNKQPDLGRPETLLAYHLNRQEMRLRAEDMKVVPQRLSFLWLAQAVSNALRFCPLETPGTNPKRLAVLRIQAQHFMLPADDSEVTHEWSSQTSQISQKEGWKA